MAQYFGFVEDDGDTVYQLQDTSNTFVDNDNALLFESFPGLQQTIDEEITQIESEQELVPIETVSIIIFMLK